MHRTVWVKDGEHLNMLFKPDETMEHLDLVARDNMICPTISVNSEGVTNLTILIIMHCKLYGDNLEDS